MWGLQWQLQDPPIPGESLGPALVQCSVLQPRMRAALLHPGAGRAGMGQQSNQRFSLIHLEIPWSRNENKVRAKSCSCQGALAGLWLQSGAEVVGVDRLH